MVDRELGWDAVSGSLLRPPAGNQTDQNPPKPKPTNLGESPPSPPGIASSSNKGPASAHATWERQV